MKRAADTETSERASKKAATRGSLHPDELETIDEGSSATVPDINEINTIHENYSDGRVIQDVESVHHQQLRNSYNPLFDRPARKMSFATY
jgi:hypothetical protein